MHTDLPMNRSKNCLESKHPLKANKFFYFNLEQDLKPQQCIGTTTIEITNSIHQKPRKKKESIMKSCSCPNTQGNSFNVNLTSIRDC